MRIKDDREQILAALQKQTPPPAPDAGAPPVLSSPPHDLTAAFIAAAERNAVCVARVDDAAAAPLRIREFLQKHDLPPRVVCTEACARLPWQAAGISASVAAPREGDQCGVTGVVAAAADSGAMLLSDAARHEMTASLLPPYHVAIVRAGDIVAGMSGLWRRLPSPLPRGCALVCGPSRTADIEQTLHLGAHGPLAVLAVVIS